MLIQMNRNLYHDSLSVVECSGTSWSVLDRRGVREWQNGFRGLKPPDCKQGPLAQFGRAPDF